MDLKTVWDAYLRYFEIKSLSRREGEMWKVVLEDFGDEALDYSSLYRKYKAPYPVKINDPENKLLFYSHMDKRDVPYLSPVFFDKSEFKYIQGQLDDTICMAILYALSQETKINVMFTCEEEIGNAHGKIYDVLDALEAKYGCRYIPIDCDIDIFYQKDSWANSISLRSGDDISEFSPEVVSNFRRIASDIGVPYSAKEDWVICTTGLLLKEARKKILGTYVGLPILNYHTEKEIVALSSLNQYYRFIKEVNKRKHYCCEAIL